MDFEIKEKQSNKWPLTGYIPLVKKRFSEYIERVHVDDDNVIAFKVSKDLLGTDNPAVLLSPYPPPPPPPYIELLRRD